MENNITPASSGAPIVEVDTQKHARKENTPLALWRIQRGLTQSELGELVGVSQWMLNRIERKKKDPSVRVLRRLINLTDLPAEDLISL